MAHFALAEILRRSNRWKEAVSAYNAATRLKENACWSAAQASSCYMQLGDMEGARRVGQEAVKLLEQAIKFDSENANAYAMGRFVLRTLGQDERALEWANRAIELDPGDHQKEYNIACFFLLTGQSDRAFDILDRCMPQLGEAQLTWMQSDPDFDTVRDHPRYLAFFSMRNSVGMTLTPDRLAFGRFRGQDQIQDHQRHWR